MNLQKSILIPLFLSLFFPMGLKAQEAQTQSASPPVLENLAADWWRYIDNAGDQLPSRVATIETQLKALPKETYGTIGDEIMRAFHAYQLILNKKPVEPIIEQMDPAAEVTVDDIIAMNRQHAQIDSDLQFHQDSLGELQSTQAQAEKALSALTLTYLKIPKGDSARLSQALVRIQDRIQLGIIEQAIKNEKRSVQSLVEVLAAGKKALDEALTRIRFDNLDAAELNARLQALELIERKQGTELTEAHAALLEISETTETEKALSRFKSQGIAKLQVERNRIAVEGQTVRLKLILNELALGDEKPDSKSLRRLFNLTEELIKSSQQKLDRWQTLTRNELNSANALLASSKNAELANVANSRIALAQTTAETIAQSQQELRDLELLKAVFEQRMLLSMGGTSKALGQASFGIGEFWDESVALLSTSLFEVNDTPVTSLGLLRFCFILLLAWALSRVVRFALRKVSKKEDGSSSSAVLTLSRILHYFILFVGFMISLTSLGIDITKLALIATALSVGIGFGLQNLINNFVSGVILMFERSLRVGDFIELQSGVVGEVREMNIRSTVVTTNDNVDIVVPNSEFVSGRVTSWTMRDAYRRVRIPFGVAYGTDKKLVEKAALEAAAATPHTLHTKLSKRQPQVWLVSFGDSCLNFELVVWLGPDAVKRPGAVTAAFTWELETALTKYGIEIPFPQHDLHIRSGLSQQPTLGKAESRDVSESIGAHER